MRELLILPLLAFLLHCSWIEATANPGTTSLNCANLTAKFTFDQVSACTELKRDNTKPAAQLSLKGVDDARWSKLAAALKSITNVDIVVEESSITKIDLPSMTGIVQSQLIVKNNPSLQTIHIGVGFASELNGLTISDNPKLAKFVLATTQPRATFAVVAGEVRISDNKILELVTIPGFGVIKGLYIEGNPHMTSSSLQLLKDSVVNGTTTEIQDEGECIFKKNISDLGELIGCKYVKGDLKIDHNAKGDAKGVKLTKITGEVNLGNLPKEKAAFLDGAEVDPNNIKSDICVELNTQEKPNYANQKRCSGECQFENEISNLSELKGCKYVDGDLKVAKGAKGSAVSINLTRITAVVHLKDPKMEQVDFLYDIRIDGQTFCQFNEEVANLKILYLCNVVKGDLNLTEGVNGSAGNGVLTKVEGNVNLKDAKEKQLGFMKGTDVTGNIFSWCLASLHGKNITKTGPCSADFTTTAPNTTVAPTTSASSSKSNSTSSKKGKVGIFRRKLVPNTILIVLMVVLLFLDIGLFIFIRQSKKKKMKMAKKLKLEKLKKRMEKPKIPVVVHLPLELTAVNTIYDPIQLIAEESKKRLGLLVQHILIFNPLEFLKVVGQMKYSYYLPNSEDTRGEPMKKEYDNLLAKYKDWQPSMPVVPVPAVEQDRSNGEINLDKEKQKLWDTILSQNGNKKVALCLWSHDDLDSIYPTLLPFLEKETNEEKEEIKRELREEGERKQSGRVKKSTAVKSEQTTSMTISREQPPAEATTTTIAATPAGNEPVKYNFPVGEIQVYMDYFHKKYEPAGKEDEGMATISPFYVLKKMKENWKREQLSFVVASAWPMRALGEDKYLTFRAIHWAKKQLPQKKVYVLTDAMGHKEECAAIAQCLYDSIMEPSRPPITFLGACRLITARKQKSWDNCNMLMFLQRNLLYWAVDAGILKSDDPKLINWDKIYRCLMLRSRATPSTRVYDPENLPCPQDLWPLEYNEQNRTKNAVVKDDEPFGIFKCDLGRAAPEPLTTAGRLGALEPMRFIDKPIGFQAAWGKDALRDGGAREDGMTTNSTVVTDPQKKKKLEGKTAAEIAEEYTFQTLKEGSQRILATSANAKLNKRLVKQLPKTILVEGGLSEQEHRNLVRANYDGSEFHGYRLASDIDNFVYVAKMKDCEYVRPQTRGYKWRKLDESRFNNKSKMALKRYKSQEDGESKKKKK